MKLREMSFTRGIMASVILSAGLSSYAAEMEEIVVKGDLGSLPGENVKSVFGFNKSILETPRSVSTISEEMMERFNERKEIVKSDFLLLKESPILKFFLFTER